MSREIVEAMKALAVEKGIAPDRLVHALEDALLSAYKKQPGAAKYARVEMDPDTGDYRVIELIVPERLEAHLIVETIDEGTYIDPETGEPVEPQDPEIDPAKFEEYRDQIDERDVTPDDFGRIAAQTAKQVILQRIREAERDMMFEEYRDRVGELITGIVQQSDSRYTLVQLRERVEALLPKSEQVDGERYDHSQRIKAVIKEVSPSTKGPSIIVSRRDPELIKKLFELEVPEIADGLVEIANVAREPGYRSKIAVVSYADGVDPVGACVGPRGSRVRMVVSELRGEKIDIIPYNDEPARFVAKALSPARVREVLVDPPSWSPTTSSRWPSGARARTRAWPRGSPVGASTSSPRPSSPPRSPTGVTPRRRPAGAARRSWATGAAAPTRRCRARASAAWTATRRSRAPGRSTSPASPRRRRSPRTARSRTPSPRRGLPRTARSRRPSPKRRWPRARRRPTATTASGSAASGSSAARASGSAASGAGSSSSATAASGAGSSSSATASSATSPSCAPGGGSPPTYTEPVPSSAWWLSRPQKREPGSAALGQRRPLPRIAAQRPPLSSCS